MKDFETRARELSQRLFNAALRPDLVSANDPTLFSEAAKALEDLPRAAHNAAVGQAKVKVYGILVESGLCALANQAIESLRLPSPEEKKGGW